MKSRSLMIGAAAACVAVLVPAAAFAAAEPTMTAQITPAKSGTLTSPKPARLKFEVQGTTALNLTVSDLQINLPKQVKINTTNLQTCSVAKLNASGPDACRKGSLVGTGAASAFLGPNKQPLDFKLSLYPAGKDSFALYLKGLVSIAFPVKVQKAAGSKGQALKIAIPQALQVPVAGTYAYLNKLSANVYSVQNIQEKYRKNGKTLTRTVKQSLLTTTGCPASKQYAFETTLNFVANPVAPPVSSSSLTGTAKCS